MSRFFLSVKSMLRDYGVDITVYPYDDPSEKPHYHYAGGIRVSDGDNQVAGEQRHEPVVPFNSQNSFMADFLPAGELTEADLVWISTAKYPINTIVDVPSQGGRFRVVNFSNYHDYSDAVIYELKGDDQHPNGR